MKYNPSLKYKSPLVKLLSMTECLNKMSGYPSLKKFIESLISMDEAKVYSKVEVAEVLKEIEWHISFYNGFSYNQYHLTFDDNHEKLSELKQKKHNIESVIGFKRCQSNKLKKEIKADYPELWACYLEIKQFFGKERVTENRFIASSVRDINFDLVGLIKLFSGSNSFQIEHLILLYGDRNKYNFDKYKNILVKDLNLKSIHDITEESFKTVRTYILIDIIKSIYSDFKNVKEKHIKRELIESNAISDKKLLKKLLLVNSKAKYIIEKWTVDIEENDINYKLISVK